MKIWVPYHSKRKHDFCFSTGIFPGKSTFKPTKGTCLYKTGVDWRLMELVPIAKRGRRR